MNDKIIRKVIKVNRENRHNDSWKVAYADFVTAMMAFFLLMWLINMTTVEQKKGIASYFAPIGVTHDPSGSSGAMNKGNAVNETGDLEVTAKDDNTFPTDNVFSSEKNPKGGENESADEEDTFRHHRDYDMLQKTQRKIDAIVSGNKDLRETKDNIAMTMTDEGLKIDITDADEQSMFPSGSAVMYEVMKRIVFTVAKNIINIPNKIKIIGHTDAQPYQSKSAYTNWDLSFDRANSTRKAIIDAGFPENRIDSVSGKEDNELLVKEDPYSPKNRRISVIILYERGKK
jgi:chemotaxis protein MotB